jgi:hypothetical protein
VDGALERGDLRKARSLAVQARLPSGLVAVRAVALGLPELASEQARLVLAADPRDADAWIALLTATDLLGNTAAFQRTLSMPFGYARLDPLSVRLMTEVLARRVGPEAAAAWLRAYGNLPRPRDSLERALERRLEASHPEAGTPD